MSRGDVQFRHTDGPMLVICDVCDTAKRDAGAVRITRNDTTGPYVQTICDTCAVEIACVVVREFYAPDARAKAIDPPPEPDRSGGGS